jgi:hypothetical protein
MNEEQLDAIANKVIHQLVARSKGGIPIEQIVDAVLKEAGQEVSRDEAERSVLYVTGDPKEMVARAERTGDPAVMKRVGEEMQAHAEELLEYLRRRQAQRRRDGLDD